MLVEATDNSCALLADVTAAWGDLEEHTLAGLDADERRELARLLAKVEENLCTETADCPERRQPDRTSSTRSTSAAEL